MRELTQLSECQPIFWYHGSTFRRQSSIFSLFTLGHGLFISLASVSLRLDIHDFENSKLHIFLVLVPIFCSVESILKEGVISERTRTVVRTLVYFLGPWTNSGTSWHISDELGCLAPEVGEDVTREIEGGDQIGSSWLIDLNGTKMTKNPHSECSFSCIWTYSSCSIRSIGSFTYHI